MSDWSSDVCSSDLHNVAVFGKSGSGKSVTLQELCASLCGAGARVVVIDDGRSFEHSAKLQGGAFVEFTLGSGFCLNPFSMIDEELAATDEDYLLDCMAMLKAIVNQMRSEEHTSELQSLMRISYAVFCLKKKKYHNITTINMTHTAATE